MPIPGARYRVKTTKGGKKVRLAFKGSKVVEAKNLATGETHTPKEFAGDKVKAKRKKRIMTQAKKTMHNMNMKA